ncbi:hypothetical protein AB0C69_19855 [Actinomadura sp. NPDC048032]|uniref:hypothetical protein n=1 Tax=Actinomadura sp. NPDC048032 TaxID=3155747 RepID=UPI0033D268B6
MSWLVAQGGQRGTGRWKEAQQPLGFLDAVRPGSHAGRMLAQRLDRENRKLLISVS